MCYYDMQVLYRKSQSVSAIVTSEVTILSPSFCKSPVFKHGSKTINFLWPAGPSLIALQQG